MSLIPRRLLSTLTASVLLGALAAPSAQARPAACKAWRLASTTALPIGSYFEDVSGTSPTDAWAVGGAQANGNVIGHWDGRRWESVSSNDPNTTLYDVLALSATDAWAVGYYGDPQGRFVNARVLHWDGTAWSVSPAPKGGSYAFLYSVSAVSASDLWAVGWGQDHQGASRPLTFHFDGSRWTRIDTGGTEGLLLGVAAIGPADVWAVGYQNSDFSSVEPLVEHWDGIGWSVVPTPPIQGDTNLLYDVSGTASNDVWAAGALGGTGTPPLTLHWDGTAWSVVPAAYGPGKSFALLAIKAISVDDVWAVGQWVTPDLLHKGPAAEHWDGSAWTIVPMRSPGTFGALRGIDASSSQDVWTVGFFYDGSSDSHPLAEHSKGPCPGDPRR